MTEPPTTDPDFSAPRDPDPARRLAAHPVPTTASDPIQGPILVPTRREDPDSEVLRAVDPACPLYHPHQVHIVIKIFSKTSITTNPSLKNRFFCIFLFFCHKY